MTVEARHIQAAAAILARIAFSRGEDSDPAETLRLWRKSEGVADGVVEQASLESAQETVEEIEQVIAEGGEIGLHNIRDFLQREYETAWQLGWICRARRDSRSEEETVHEAAERAEQEVRG